MRRAQISIFLIFGVLVLFGAVLYMALSIPKAVSKSAIIAEADLEFLKSSVQECLDSSSEDAILIAGRQGGVIYSYNVFSEEEINEMIAAATSGTPLYESFNLPGLYLRKDAENEDRPSYGGGRALPLFLDVNPDTTDDDVFLNVSYGLLAPLFTSGIETTLPPPDYPVPDRILEPSLPGIDIPFQRKSASVAELIQGNFPALCNEDGKNSRTNGLTPYSCETYNNVNLSIQSYLEDYTRFATHKCMLEMIKNQNLDSLSPYLPHPDNVTVDTYIGDENVVFTLNYSVSTEDGLETLTFTSRNKVRLKLIYELATHLVKEDSDNIFFDKVEDNKLLRTCKAPWPLNYLVPCSYDGMDVRKIENACQQEYFTDVDNIGKWKSDSCFEYSKHDDIYNITDSRSVIRGKPFNFFFSVENRIPALDYIHNTKESPKYDKIYDIVVMQGARITIVPEGFDPDDEFKSDCKRDDRRECMQYTYTYDFWKATYDEEFAFDASQNIIGIKNSDGTLLVTYFPDVNPELIEDLKSAGLPQHDISKVTRVYGFEELNHWHDSLEYKDGKKILDDGSEVEIGNPGRIASYQTDWETDIDVGPHILKVNICDQAGKCDYQLVRIYVKQIEGGGINTYEEIENKHASVEDPYSFRLGNDDLEGGMLEPGVYDFYWSDNCAGGGIICNLENSEDVSAKCDLIKTIEDVSGKFEWSSWRINPLTSSLSDCNNERRLLFVAKDQSGNEKARESYPLYIHECLPHGIHYEAFGRPYPYVAQEDASNICCKGLGDTYSVGSGWGEFQSSDMVCFEQKDLMSYYTLYESGIFSGNLVMEPADKAMISSSSDGSLLDATVSEKSIKLYDTYGTQLYTHEDIYLNDFVRRDYKQYCSGDRGNVCSGLIDDKAILIVCLDKDELKGEDETCYAPCDPTLLGCTKNDILNGGYADFRCNYYTAGNSFELNFENNVALNTPFELIPEAIKQNLLRGKGYGEYGAIDGICNPTKKCSDSYNLYYPEGRVGQFLTVGACGEGGCTAGITIEECIEPVYVYDPYAPANNYHLAGVICQINPGLEDECAIDPYVVYDIDDYFDYCYDANFNFGGTKTFDWLPSGSDINHGGYTNRYTNACCGDDPDEKIIDVYCCPSSSTTIEGGSCA